MVCEHGELNKNKVFFSNIYIMFLSLFFKEFIITLIGNTHIGNICMLEKVNRSE